MKALKETFNYVTIFGLSVVNGMTLVGTVVGVGLIGNAIYNVDPSQAGYGMALFLISADTALRSGKTMLRKMDML